jgi:hypothetical protein
MHVSTPSGKAMTVYLLRWLLEPQKRCGFRAEEAHGPQVNPLSAEDRTLTLMTPLGHAREVSEVWNGIPQEY